MTETTITTWTLLEADGVTEIAITSVADLDRELDRLTAEAEAAAEAWYLHLFAAGGPKSGPTMALGVGAAFSFASVGSHYVPGDLDNGEASTWLFCDEASELPPGRGIQVETARQVAREFVRTVGQRAEHVEWSQG